MLGIKKEIRTHDSDYTLDFGAGINNDGSVHFTDHTREHERDIGIFLDNQAFNYRVKQEFPSAVADLIDLAIAIANPEFHKVTWLWGFDRVHADYLDFHCCTRQ